MTSQQRERMNQLCSKMANEQNPARFHQLVVELNALLEEKSQRLEGNLKTDAEPSAEGKSA